MKNLVSESVDLSARVREPTQAGRHPPPNHVAIIMDGNGRWAEGRGKSRSEGHQAGAEKLRRIVKSFSQSGVNYLTLFAFSTENWRRPEVEVQGLIEILAEVIKSEVQDLHEQGVRVRHLGRLDRLSPQLQQAIRDSIELTKNNTGMTLIGAFD